MKNNNESLPAFDTIDSSELAAIQGGCGKKRCCCPRQQVINNFYGPSAPPPSAETSVSVSYG